MKLYYFNPHNYGAEFFVMAESQEKAIESLNKYLENNEDYCGIKWGDDFFKASDKWPNLYPGYTIDVYEANQIIESEIS